MDKIIEHEGFITCNGKTYTYVIGDLKTFSIFSGYNGYYLFTNPNLFNRSIDIHNHFESNLKQLDKDYLHGYVLKKYLDLEKIILDIKKDQVKLLRFLSLEGFTLNKK